MCISGAIYCSICVDPVQPTFFDRIFIVFLEKCSPPSLGSMIFKAACMQNFETITFFLAFQIDRTSAPFGSTYCISKLTKTQRKLCIFCLWPLLGSSVSHYVLRRLHFGMYFPIFASFSPPIPPMHRATRFLKQSFDGPLPFC